MSYTNCSITKVRSRSPLHASFVAAIVLFAATALPAYSEVTQTVLYSFLGGTDGGIVYAPVVADKSGHHGAAVALYGTTGYGGAINAPNCLNTPGAPGCGIVFKLTPSAGEETPWQETVLASFTGGADGDLPLTGLLPSEQRISQTTSLYGTTSGLNGGPGAVFKITGHILTPIWTFTGGNDGSDPEAALIADQRGALYGTASEGGPKGCGAVYKLTPPKFGQSVWTEQTLWGFLGGTDGCLPWGLLADEQGVLYGTTYSGGASNKGVVFKLTPPEDGKGSWSEQILWTFSGGNDGANPFSAEVIADRNGALYGTTSSGGASGAGVVFKLTPPAHRKTAWTEETLWSFSGGGDGGFPTAPVLADRMGALYGTTAFSGASGAGVVFKLTPPKHGQTGWTDTTLWTFSGGADGNLPAAPLVADGRGVIYGTTQYGGAFGPNPICTGIGCGVVFELTGTGFVPDH